MRASWQVERLVIESMGTPFRENPDYLRDELERAHVGLRDAEACVERARSRLGDALRCRRVSLGLSLRAAGVAWGVSASAICQMETGARAVSPKVLRAALGGEP